MLLFVLFTLANAQNITDTTMSAISTRLPIDINNPLMGIVYFIGAFITLAVLAGIYQAVHCNVCHAPQKPILSSAV